MCEKNELEIAWAAGLFEGEGCILIDGKTRKYPSLGLSIAMTDEDVIRRFSRVVGIEKTYPVSSSGPGHKQQYRWKTSKRAEVERILELFIPYFGERRLLKALEALNSPSSGIRWGEGSRAGESAKYRARNKNDK